MGTILSRIKDLVINEGITVGHLERQIGASKGVLSRAMKNGSDIQSKWLQTIATNYPAYSTKWLLTGVGNMLAESKLLESNVDYEKSCLKCVQYEQRIADLNENIALLKETISVQKELIISLKHNQKG